MSHVIQNPNFKSYFEENIKQEIIEYSREEHNTWKYLILHTIKNLQDLAHNKALDCLDEILLPRDYIPQLGDVSEKLYKKSGWRVIQVEGLIQRDYFFQLLANKLFPSTVYIRGNEELALSKDPDIFHEVFGHCPILLDTAQTYLKNLLTLHCKQMKRKEILFRGFFGLLLRQV